MVRVSRLLTFVDIDDADDDGPDARRMSVTARHEAVLNDGRQVLLLDDRGWNGQLSGASTDSVWAFQTIEGVIQAAREVVGPDEPFTGTTHAEMEAGHWEALAGALREQGVTVVAAELSELRHDVELSKRLRERVSGALGDTG